MNIDEICDEALASISASMKAQGITTDQLAVIACNCIEDIRQQMHALNHPNSTETTVGSEQNEA